MSKEKKNNRGILLMAVGLLLLVGAGLMVYTRNITEEEAGVYSEQMGAVLKSQIPNYGVAENHGSVENLLSAFNLSEEEPILVEGSEFIGVLDIPSLGLSLPIQEDSSGEQLQISPCRYRGSYNSNNLIIAGHNYPAHFGMFYKIRYGDDVWFTDTSGNVHTYRVVSIETLTNTDVKEMEYGRWDLTLFTCTSGGVNRLTVRCELY